MIADGDISLDEVGSDAASFSLQLIREFAVFSDESDATNPCVPGAYILFVRDAVTWFGGKIRKLDKDESTGKIVKINCLDDKFDIDGTLCTSDGATKFEVSSPTVKLEDVPLVPLGVTDGMDADSPYPVYPAFSTATNTPDSTSPWIARSKSRTTKLAQLIANGSTLAPFKIVDGRQLQAPCFLHINSELMYIKQVYKSGGFWWVEPSERGALGSTGTAHANTSDVYQRVLKTISDFDAAPLLRRNPSSTLITAQEYDLKCTEGRFNFRNDPSSYTAFFADEYYVFDQDAAGAHTLGSLVTQFLQVLKADGGPELTAGQIDTTELDEIFVPRTVIEDLRTAEAIDLLIDQAATLYGGDARQIIWFWSSREGKATFRSARQGSADHRFPHASQKRQGVDFTGVYSAVGIRHFSDEPSLLLSKDRFWHPTVGDQANHAGSPGGGTTNLINAIMHQDFERQQAYGWQADSGTVSNNIYTEKLLDGDPSTGWGIRCAGRMWTAGAPCYLLFAWFNQPQVIDYLYAVLDARLYIDDAVLVEIVGITSYTPGDPPTWSDPVGLGASFRLINGTQKTNFRPNHWVANRPGD